MQTPEQQPPFAEMDLADLLAAEATIPVYHRGRVFTVTCNPEKVTPAYKMELVKQAAGAAVALLNEEPEQPAKGKGKKLEQPEPAFDGDTRFILETCTGWSLTRAGVPVPLTGAEINGLSYGLKWAIVRAVTLEAQNPTNAPA